ncbi:MAG: hypothetical protein HOV94_43880 [Saccharothrix sp.]|nr:hypothetical protein [Saccharothrix sp.]
MDPDDPGGQESRSDGDEALPAGVPLHSYLDPGIAADARAVAEAATIAVALEAKHRDLPPLTTTPIAIGEADDVAQLVLIADAFTGSPIVADPVKEFRDQHDLAH